MHKQSTSKKRKKSHNSPIFLDIYRNICIIFIKLWLFFKFIFSSSHKGGTVLKRRILFFSICFLLLVIVLVIWVIWSNTALQLNTYTVESSQLPLSFDGFRIAQISDLHNSELDEGNQKLLSLLQESKPDIIVVTGDLIDSRRTDVEVAMRFIRAAVKIAPVYYVTGNHESRVPSDFALLEAGMTEAGVCTLREDAIMLALGSEKICLAGIDDPNYYVSVEAFTEALSALCSSEEFTLLLSHRPEYFESYVAAGADLTLSGHAHGGQFRLPFVGGLIAPNQGFFPEYDSGIYREGESAMIVSRGIGNSIFPFRFNNRPEIVLVELHCSQEQ